MGSRIRSGSRNSTTSQPIPPISAVFTSALSTSTKLSIDTMRFSPSAGFSFSSLGLSLSGASTGPVCRNSVSTEMTITGRTVSPRIRSSVRPACAPTAPIATLDGSLAASKARAASPVAWRATSPAQSTPTTSQAIRPAVLVTSLDLGTSPFLRASRRRLGVGFSVLSPPSFLLATARPLSAAPPPYRTPLTA